jgi:hypothetical protein
MKNADLSQDTNRLLYQSDQNDADRFLRSLQVQSGLNNDDVTRKLQVLASLMSSGALTQGTQQKALDQPFKALQMLIQSTPGLNNTGSTTTSTSSQPFNPASLLGPLGMLLGGPLGGLLGGGAGGAITLGSAAGPTPFY